MTTGEPMSYSITKYMEISFLIIAPKTTRNYKCVFEAETPTILAPTVVERNW